jgi:hypothetical protein
MVEVGVDPDAAELRDSRDSMPRERYAPVAMERGQPCVEVPA